MKELLKTSDYDFLRNNPHLGNNIIILAMGGSHAYGTNVEGSDVDVRGIALNSKEEVLLQRDFEQVIDNATDTVIYSFSKIVKLLADGNPNVLEILFQDEDAFLYMNDVGKLLYDNRHLFLSKRCFYTFGGYARQQLRKLDNKTMRELPQSGQEVHILNSIKNAEFTFREKYFERPDDSIKLYVDVSEQENMDTEIFMDVHLSHYPLRDYKCMWDEMHNIVKDYNRIGKRASNAILHGKVNKHAMHLVRLMLCCIDILRKGEFSTYCGKYLDLLMDIRNGKYMGEDNQLIPQFFEMVDYLEKEMQLAFEESTLPEKPDAEKINALLYRVNEMIVLNSKQQ